MARRKAPGNLKSLASDFARDLTLEERTSRARPNALNSGNEQQSELEPSYRPPAAAPQRRSAPARPKAAPSRPKAPTPPRRPPQGPTTPTYPPGPPDPIFTGTPGAEPPLYMPQVDPLGGVTGPMAPPAPGSSTQGVPPTWQPTDQIPPLTGPGSDRAVPPFAPSAPAPMPAPMTGPGSDRAVPAPGAIGPTSGPQGLLDSLGAYLKNLPPLRNPF